MDFLLPTQKPHVSFSEVREWTDCPHRHRLKYVEKIDNSEPSTVLEFGTAVHAACELYLKSKVIDLKVVKDKLDEAWTKFEGKEGFTTEEKEKLLEISAAILAEVPSFMNQNFTEWEYISAEELLYESIEGSQAKFKGLVDGIITCYQIQKNGKKKKLVWIIDWKTSAAGWSPQKKSDKMTQAQLVLYKHFWSTKHQVELSDIRCGFVILKKSAKPGKRCELIPVSVGPLTIKKTLKVLNNAVNGIIKGLDIKNRNSCKYCDFKNTPNCT